MTKKNNTKQTFTIIISLVLAVLLIYLAVRNIDWAKSKEALQNANYFWVGFSMILGILAYGLRSYRWRMLLEATGHTPSQMNTLAAICINYISNIGIPRSGELARCTVTYHTDEVPVDQSFGTVITERIIDLICLGLVFLLALSFNYELVMKMSEKALSFVSPRNYIIFGITFSIVLILLFLLKNRIKSLNIYDKIKNFVLGLKKGVLSIFKLKKPWLFWLLTLLIWVFYYFMTYLVVFSLPTSAHLGFGEGLFLLIAGGIGMIIPASGGIGSYHQAMIVAFSILGLSDQAGFDFAILIHTPHTLIALILGGLSLIYVAEYKKKQKRQSGKG